LKNNNKFLVYLTIDLCIVFYKFKIFNMKAQGSKLSIKSKLNCMN